jgi:hypothetical protein
MVVEGSSAVTSTLMSPQRLLHSGGALRPRPQLRGGIRFAISPAAAWEGCVARRHSTTFWLEYLE